MMSNQELQQRILDLSDQLHRVAMNNAGEDAIQGCLAGVEELLEIVTAQQSAIEKLQKQVEGIEIVLRRNLQP